MKSLIQGVMFLCVFLLSSCANTGASSVTLAQSLPSPDTTRLIQTGDIRVMPLDNIQIKVFGLNELNGQYQLDHLGRIKVPLIGEIQASGLTALELAEVVETRLEENYLQNADVTVSIDQNSSEVITVEGSVNKPGMFPIRGKIGLLQAVALAGGPSDMANPRKVVIFRQVEGERTAAGFDLSAIRKGEADDPVVFGNDIIVVDGSEARKRYGDILRSIPLLGLLIL
jgi:polysaccharide biosynthesis/export protein